MMCARCTFELAYAIWTSQPEPFGRITLKQREAALDKIEKAGLKVPAKMMAAAA